MPVQVFAKTGQKRTGFTLRPRRGSCGDSHNGMSAFLHASSMDAELCPAPTALGCGQFPNAVGYPVPRSRLFSADYRIGEAADALDSDGDSVTILDGTHAGGRSREDEIAGQQCHHG